MALDDEAHHHLPSLVRADGTIAIELHHKLGSSGSAPDFDITTVWANAVPFDAGDTTCLRPSDEDLLVHVCLHFLVDRVRLFSRRALRQICDIGAIIDAFANTLEWDRLTAEAAERRYAEALAVALGTATMIVDTQLPDDLLANLAPHRVAPDAVEVARRRVLRDPAWTSLERLTSRQPSVLHLLPPNPARWSPDDEAQRPAGSLAEGYSEWLVASSRILGRPGEVGTERRVAAQLQALVFPAVCPTEAVHVVHCGGGCKPDSSWREEPGRPSATSAFRVVLGHGAQRWSRSNPSRAGVRRTGRSHRTRPEVS